MRPAPRLKAKPTEQTWACSSCARQRFHDRNTYGVNMSASLAISMASTDPITKLTRELVEHSAILRGNVEMPGAS